MDTYNFYLSKAQYHSSQKDLFQKKENYLTFLRLICFILLVYLILLCFNISVLIGTLSIFPAIAIFGYVLNLHLKASRIKLKHQYLAEINLAEADCINGNYSNYATGNEYNDKSHPYSNDMDILGNHSLFQYINRTCTEPGASLLAKWLLNRSPYNEINQRQEAIKELKDKFDWRQNLRSIFYLNPSSVNNPQPLLDWCNETSEFKKQPRLIYLLIFQTLITIALIVLSFWGIPEVWVIAALSINFGINSSYFRKVNAIQNKLSKSYSLLESYSEIIQTIEKEDFKSEKLVGLQKKFLGIKTASKNIKKLSLLSQRLDYRLNILVGIPLNLFFFWDIHQCLLLEKWKSANKNKMEEWFGIMAEFEALSSLANLHFNQPHWAFAKVTDGYFKLKATNAGHPLILPKQRVDNSFEINQNNKIAIVTGSNMSGKSTFLRTIGVNMVLAFAGAPVCANEFEVSYVKIYSSMRISDSLEDNTSSFYAELKKLAEIIKVVENKERVFLLLDEILRGTNSNDRHTGSVALIRQLIKNNAPAIIATHDLSLSQLKQKLPDNIDLYNFDVKIEGEELFFDYKSIRACVKA